MQGPDRRRKGVAVHLQLGFHSTEVCGLSICWAEVAVSLNGDAKVRQAVLRTGDCIANIRETPSSILYNDADPDGKHACPSVNRRRGKTTGIAPCLDSLTTLLPTPTPNRTPAPPSQVPWLEPTIGTMLPASVEESGVKQATRFRKAGRSRFMVPWCALVNHFN